MTEPTPVRGPSRRALLAGLGLLPLAAGCGSTEPVAEEPMTPETIPYGEQPLQFGELTRPSGEPRGTVVVVHGGFWQARYGLEYGRDLAADLAQRGWVAWNIEYRRVGNGGGFPTTFDDVAAAIDHLAELDVDTAAVAAVGHSAGGQLAVWAAGRPGLPLESGWSAPRVPLAGVVSQAGVLDLAGAARQRVGGESVLDLVGGGPEDQPERYPLIDPLAQVPLAVPVVCVHGTDDTIVPLSQSRDYVEAATAVGARASLVEVGGDHFAVIDPASPAWGEGRFVEMALSGAPD